MKIIVYGANWCTYCDKLKLWLKENNFNYTYKNVDDPEVSKEFSEMNYHGIPLTLIKTKSDVPKVIQGFNPLEIKKLLQ